MSRKTKSQKKLADQRRRNAIQNMGSVQQTETSNKVVAQPEKPVVLERKAPQYHYEETDYDRSLKKETWKDLAKTLVIISALLGIQMYIFFVKG